MRDAPVPRKSQSPLERAMALINQVLLDLRAVVEQLDLALENLEEADRQKIADEAQIRELERALQRLRHQPSDRRRSEEPAQSDRGEAA